MMRFSCTACHEMMECPETQAGTKASCPKCGLVARIPLLAMTAPVPVATRATPDSIDYVTRCYYCGDMVSVSDAHRVPFAFAQSAYMLVDCCGPCFRFFMWWIGIAVAAVMLCGVVGFVVFVARS